MAIYHLNVSFISRSTGRSAVQSVAYITGMKLYENRRGIAANYQHRSDDILYTETLAPDHAPDWAKDPTQLWNKVTSFEDEYAEKRYKTPASQEWYKGCAQEAMRIIIALPKELSAEEMIELSREFVEDRFVSRGLAVTFAIHQDEGNPHLHAVITRRSITGDGEFSWTKDRDICSKKELGLTRKLWADYANHYLALEGHSVRIDHRSFVDQGIDLTPSRKRGYMGDKQGKQGRIVFENEQIWLANRDKLMEDLTPLLRELNNTHATFTQKDIVASIQKRFGDETVIVSQVFEKVLQSVHYAGTDMNGYARYTSHDYKQWEDEVIRASQALAKASFDYSVKDTKIEQAFDRQPKERELSEEQQKTVRTLVGNQSFAVLNGLAGTGKTTTLRIVADLYQEAGCRVIGASVSALASDKLGKEAGIHSRTLESWLIRWKKYEEARQEYLKFKDIIPSSALGKYQWYRDLKSYEKDRLSEKDVLILDEASMVGVKDAHKLLYYVYQSGAKVIFVGDEAQLQAISAGNFFKLAQETAARFGSFVEMKQIRRQEEEWMQKASVLFAEGSVQEALREYEKQGCIQGLKAEEAITKIAQEYGAAYAQAVRKEKWQSEVSELLVLTSTNKDCDVLNTAIRQQLREKGVLSREDAFVLRQSRKEDDPKVLAPLADEKDHQGQQDKNNPNKVQSESDKAIAVLPQSRKDDEPKVLAPLADKKDQQDHQGQQEKNNSNKVQRGYAIGDQILFLQNDSSHPDYRKVEIFDGSGKFQEKEYIKNNSEGVIQKVTAREGGGFEVQVTLLGEKNAPERYAIFNTNDYSAFNYGYSKTVHRVQGQDKSKTWIYATKAMDAFAMYVAMTRHRLQAVLYYALEQFPTYQKFVKVVSRGEMKDNIRDWTILDQNQDSYDRVMHYKSLCADTAVLYKDKEFDGDKDEAYKALAADRKMIAKEILGQWQSHKKYVLQAGFSQEMLEITAGYKEKQLSRAEEKASQRLEEYAKAASQARELLKEIRDYTEADLKIRGLWETLHPGQIGLEQTKHADYKRFEALRDERDKLAVEIVQDKILHSLCNEKINCRLVSLIIAGLGAI